MAQRIFNKKISVMNDKGTVFNKENLEYFIEERMLSIQMKSLGVSTGGKWKNYSRKDFEYRPELIIYNRIKDDENAIYE